MSFAVCILSFNHPEITTRCVKSSLRFYKSDQIYLVHNGSQPQFVENLKNNFPAIHHLVIEQNRGYSGGANFALDKIFQTYDWCFFVTNDCEIIRVGQFPVQPGLIAPHIHLKKFGRTDSIGGQFFANKAHLRHVKSSEEFLSVPQGQAYIPRTAFLMHKKVFECTLGFDESFHSYWEDVDLSLRTQESGLPISFNRDFELVHSVGNTFNKHPLYASFLFHRNRARLCRKRVSWRDTFGVHRAQLEVNLLVDCISHTAQLALQKRWQSAQNVLRAYYGD
jgi:GT2 family glycosyltransferase